MAGRSTDFTYSKNNTGAFKVPAEYREMLGIGAEAVAAKEKKTKRKPTSNKKGGFNFMRLIRIVAFVVMVATLVVLGDKVYQYLRDIQYSDAQNKSIAINAKAASAVEKRPTPVYPEFEGTKINTVRFDYPQVCDKESLEQFTLAYPDFSFWLYIENTTINYPVAQAPDNEFYLHRNLDGDTNISGTLFLDYRCDVKTLKGHNIIYGHNMQNGTMFGQLKNYASKSYYDDHSFIYTYTADSVTVWKIFSAYETDTNNYYIQTDFGGNAAYQDFLTKLKNDAAYDTGVEVNYTNDILTLSTCHYYTSAIGRFVVHAVKIGTTPMV